MSGGKETGTSKNGRYDVFSADCFIGAKCE